MPTDLFSAAVVLLSAVGGAAGLIGLFTIRRTNRKLESESELNSANAESTRLNAGVVISQAALNQMNAAIASSQRDSQRALELSSKNDALESRVDELEEIVRDYQRAAQLHRDWDQIVVRELKALGGHPTDPPPLFPLPA